MIRANNSDIADPILQTVAWAGPSFTWPVIAIDNATLEFVTVMPSGTTAPERISGITYTTVPAVLFSHQPVGRRDITLAGERTIAEGFADFIVVAPRNGFANQANSIAAQIAAMFPMGRRIDMMDGTIIITQPPMPMQGYDDGVYWRVVLRLNYQAM